MPNETQAARSWKNSPAGNLLVLGLATVVVLLAVWLVGYARGSSDTRPESVAAADGGVSPVDVADQDQPAPKVGEPAPQFSVRTMGGDQFDLADLDGVPAWLIFNATWCSNCRAEIPDIERTYIEVGDQLHILSIYVSDTPSAVADYSEKLGLTFPQVVDSQNEIAALYRVAGLPTHYFIDGSGDVAAVAIGTLSPDQIEQYLAQVAVTVSK